MIEINMDIPRQFREIATRMHQDIDRVLPADVDRNGFFEYLIRGRSATQREVAARFLDTLLSSDLNEKELVAVWAKAGADWYFGEKEIVKFLEDLRDALQ